jgi:DNA-binding NarL/FixJ family response regulator
MSAFMLPFAILSGVALGGIILSFSVLFYARRSIRAAEERVASGRAEWEPALTSVRQALEVLAAQVQEVRQEPPAAVTPNIPKPGLNLSKRSQALRMHRRGDSADQIAAALEIPHQEVELLIKVHRIVMSSI